MSNLLRLSSIDRARLMRRATGECAVLYDHPYPRGVTPHYGRVGIENSRGEVRLLIETDCSYSGPDPTVRELVRNSKLTFGSFGAMFSWATEHIPAADTGPRPSATAGDAADSGRQLGLLEPEHLQPSRPPAERSPTDLPDLLEHVTTEIVHQDEAIEPIVTAVRHHVAKTAPAKPLVVLAGGPTGTGKSATATLIGEWLQAADAAWATVRIDCNEFEAPHRVASLLGAPPGYVGFTETPELVRVLGEHPTSLVIFDEFEKAHPDVQIALMSAFGTGTLTSAAGGPPIDVRRSIFILTTNLGDAHFVRLQRESTANDFDERYRNALVAEGMNDAIVGRIDVVAPFRPLSEAAQAALVIAQIRQVGREYGLEIDGVHPGVALSVLDAMPPHNRFGARTLRRYVHQVHAEIFASNVNRGPVSLRWSESVAEVVVDVDSSASTGSPNE